MKTKFLAPLFGLLLLCGCGEDDEPSIAPTPEPQSFCYLLEESSRSGSGTTSTRYTYNDLNQVIRTELYEQEVLKEIRVYTYTAEGKLAREQLLAPDGEEEISFTVYSYNPQGRLSKYEVKQQNPGLELVHRLSSFKAAYDTQGRLTSATDYLYLDNREVSNGAVLQSYPQNRVNVTVRGAGGATLYTATFGQDSSNVPLAAVPVFLQRRPGIAYPNQHNITAFRATTGTGADATPVEDVAYTAIYKYNEQGYPTTATFTYEGGRVENVTYTYDCTE